MSDKNNKKTDFKTRLKNIKKLLDTEMFTKKTNPSVSDALVDFEDGESVIFGGTEDKAAVKKANDSKVNGANPIDKTKALNILMIFLIVVFAVALASLLYIGGRVSYAYEDVVSQSAIITERHDRVREDYDKIKPEYDKISQEIEDFGKAAEEAKHGNIEEVLPDGEAESK